MKVLQDTVHATVPSALHTHAGLQHHYRDCRSFARSLLETIYLLRK
jgi:hypothetical protein